MKKSILTIASLIGGAALMFAASPAMARVNVGINIGIPGPFVQPAPVYVEPQPVYVEPVYAQPVYAQPVYTEPVYYEQRVYVRPRPVYIIEGGRRGWYEHHRWHDADFHGHVDHWEHHDGRYGR